MTEPETLRTSLLYAREAVKAVKTWRRHHPKTRPHTNSPYLFCRQGWEANNFAGYYFDIPNALRSFVPEGNLSHWYQSGVSRRQMVDLFTVAIVSIPVDLEVAA